MIDLSFKNKLSNPSTGYSPGASQDPTKNRVFFGMPVLFFPSGVSLWPEGKRSLHPGAGEFFWFSIFFGNCSGPQKLDRQASNSFLIKGGFCQGQEQATIGCVIQGQGRLEQNLGTRMEIWPPVLVAWRNAFIRSMTPISTRRRW
jgi:hypothetical protein